MSKKLRYISFIQVVSMALIVLSHSISQYTAYPMWFTSCVQPIQRAGLTAFMWCAGYLLIYTKSLERYGYKNYIIRRLERLMLPFFIVQIVMLLPKMAILKLQGSETTLNVLHSFIYPREGILPHLWFLPTLMIICLLSPVLNKAMSSKLGAVLSFGITLVITLLPDFQNLLCLNDVKTYLVWFVLGMLIAQFIDKNRLKRFVTGKVAILSISIYVVAFCFVNFGPIKYMICSLCTLLILIYLAVIYARLDCKRMVVWGEYISKYTFPIYILSLPTQNIVEIVGGRVGTGWLVSTILMFIAGIVIPVLISIVIGRIEKRSRVKIISKCIGL